MFEATAGVAPAALALLMTVVGFAVSSKDGHSKQVTASWLLPLVAVQTVALLTLPGSTKVLVLVVGFFVFAGFLVLRGPMIVWYGLVLRRPPPRRVMPPTVESVLDDVIDKLAEASDESDPMWPTANLRRAAAEALVMLGGTDPWPGEWEQAKEALRTYLEEITVVPAGSSTEPSPAHERLRQAWDSFDSTVGRAATNPSV